MDRKSSSWKALLAGNLAVQWVSQILSVVTIDNCLEVKRSPTLLKMTLSTAKDTGQQSVFGGSFRELAVL